MTVREELERLFTARLRAAIEICRQLGYNPSRFERMLNDRGGLGTARHLIASGELQDGFLEVVGMGRSELTMESIMLEDEFAPLFNLHQRNAALWRLQQAQSPTG